MKIQTKEQENIANTWLIYLIGYLFVLKAVTLGEVSIISMLWVTMGLGIISWDDPRRTQ